jgi:predicted deacylase
MDTQNSDLSFKSIAYTGQRQGPRLIITGGVHGNEVCGPIAIRRVVGEIDAGELRIVAGQVTFVPVTNPLAYARGDRTGDRNLNRNLTPKSDPKDFEDHIGNWLCPLLARHDALLDLHSTRAKNPAFAMLGPHDNDGPLEPFRHSAAERALARRLGVNRFVDGWLDTYAKGVARRIAALHASGRQHNPLTTDPRYGVGTTEYKRSVGGSAITLECGQPEAPESPEIAYRAIHNALAFLGLSNEEAPAPVTQVESLTLHEVVDRAHPDDAFSREWSSFNPLRKGELIGTRHDGTKVVAEEDGYIVFPDPKALPGNEWFYLARVM